MQKKQQHNIKLQGHLLDGQIAKTHQADLVRCFKSADNKFIIKSAGNGLVQITTAKGSYQLKKHPVIENLYFGQCRNIKCHFTMKKVVAKLIYWS